MPEEGVCYPGTGGTARNQRRVFCKSSQRFLLVNHPAAVVGPVLIAAARAHTTSTAAATASATPATSAGLGEARVA